MKILIAIPSGDEVKAHFAECLVGLRTPVGTEILFCVGSLIYDARNKLAKRAVDGGFTHVLWIDSDMTFEPDTLERMIASMGDDKDVLTALCFGRKDPFPPCVYSKCSIIPEGQVYRLDVQYVQSIPEGVFPVEGCGLAGVLMKTDVLAEIVNKGVMPFSPIYGLGEDLSFCARLNNIGKKIWCDPSIQFGHVSSVVIGGQSFIDEWNNKPKKVTL